MQSSTRRKRERAENEDKGPLVAAQPSRARGARGAPAQKKLHISHEAQIGSNLDEGEGGNGETVAPSTENRGDQSEGDLKNGGSTANQSSMSLGTEENKSTSAPQKSTSPENNIEPKTSQSGKQAQKSRPSEEPNGPTNETTDVTQVDSRQQRIDALLEHRRMLLGRIKKCRSSAETRLESVNRQKATANNDDAKAEQPGSGDSVKASEARKSSGESDEDEIATFKELSRKAINAAKKQRADAEGQQEKRAPISLRRGSTVGKRMSAALSSLAPNAPAGPSSLTTEPLTLPIHQQSSGPSTVLPRTGNALPQTTVSSLRGDAIVGSSTHQVRPQTSLQPAKGSSSLKQQPSLQPSAAALAVPNRGSQAGTTRGASGHATQKLKRQKSRSYSGASNRASTSASTSEPQASATHPLHFGATGSTLPPNRLAQPAVIHPEATALRERRNLVRSQLGSLLYERQKRIAGVDLQPSSSQPTRKQISAQSFQHALRDQPAPTSFASVVSQQRGPEPPTALPRRRKTHWDYLLEEMRWLATDFIEERKWKASCARTLSSAVISNGRSTVSPLSSAIPAKEQSEKSGNLNDIEDTTQGISDDMEIGDKVGKSDREATSTTDKSKEQRLYEPLSATDGKTARMAATIVSDMIDELWDVTVEVGAMSKTDAACKLSLKRHLKRRQKLEGGHTNEMTPKGADDNKSASHTPGSESCRKPTSERTQTTTDSSTETLNVPTLQAKGQFEDLSYDAITERVDELMETTKNRVAEVADREAPVPDQPARIVLSQPQKSAAELVNLIWGKDRLPGVILSGSAGSGKTFVVCSLLWSHREEGPQLLICPPARLIRWKFELSRFEDLRIVTTDSLRGISSPDLIQESTSSCGPCDVVLCEFSSFDTAMGSLINGEEARAGSSGFCTIAMDCRHSLALPDAIDKYSFGSKFDATKDGQGSQVIPPELLSNAWWQTFLQFVSSMTARRLLIESHEYGKSEMETRYECAELEARSCLEYLSSKTAFVVGPALFYSGRHSVTKKVLSWAKRKAKAERLKEKEGSVSDILEEMKGHLSRVLDCFSRSLQGVSSLEKRSGHLKWDVRSCPLSSLQRSEYDRCCADVRGALSSERMQSETLKFPSSDPDSAAASALLRLRLVCIHPHLQELLVDFSKSGTVDVERASVHRPSLSAGRKRVLSGSGGGPFRRSELRSSSQPDVELALDILKASAKLRDLLTILRFECGYHLHGEETIVSTFDTSFRSSIQKQEVKRKKGLPRKKVVILAVLPDAQRLTSLLLNSVGIAHELLVRSPSRSNVVCNSTGREAATPGFGDPLKAEPEILQNPEAILSWIECQLALARFNSHCLAGGDADISGKASFGKTLKCMGSVDVIVASPATVSSLNGGIGINSADLVVSLDEDWSGRCQTFMSSILSMHQAKGEDGKGRARTGRQKCKFLRLVCTNTCEEIFGGKVLEQNLPDDQSLWPVDTFGYLVFPPSYSTEESLKTRKVAGSTFKNESAQQRLFPFLGSSITNHRNDDLSTVLCPEVPLPCSFLTGNKLSFLHKSVGSHVDFAFVSTLMRHEASCCPLSNLHSSERRRRTRTVDDRYLTVVPPLPADFPPAVVTRGDLFAMPSRSYIESFGNSLLWDSLGGLSNTINVQPETMSVSSPLEDNAILADSWHKSGLTCKPDDLAASLLVYRLPRSGIEWQDSFGGSSSSHGEKKSQNATPANMAVEEQKIQEHKGNADDGGSGTSATFATGSFHKHGHRFNTYSSHYSISRNGSSTVIRDGNQGCEPRVYFPPLLPRMRLCAELAEADIAALRYLKSSNESENARGENFASRKRKEGTAFDYAIQRTGKRPRIQHVPTSFVLAHSDTLDNALRLTQPLRSATQRSGGLESAEPSIVPEDDSSLNDDASFLLAIDEDYGLAGIGAVSMPLDSAAAASSTSTEASAYTSWKDPYQSNSVEHDYFSMFLPCDTEEAAASSFRGASNNHLDSVILFVAKKKLVGPWGPGYLSQLYSAGNSVGAGSQGPSATWSSTSVSSRAPASSGPVAAAGNGLVNGTGASKKKKKSHNQNAGLAGSSAFSQLPAVGFPTGAAMNAYSAAASLQATKGKDGSRNKLLPLLTGRLGGHGGTLFDHASFKLAYVRVRKRLSDRVSHSLLLSSVSSGFGPGVPLTLLKENSDPGYQQHWLKTANEPGAARWTSLVTKLAVPSDETGLFAKSQSMSQRAALRRSLVSPRRVDFGPFQAGYLSSSSGMTAIAPLNARVGVSLPMGVKVPHQQREKLQLPWTQAEDKKLQDFVVRFGLNFHLAARAVNAAEAVRAPSQNHRVTTRSARQCRERWSALTKDQPSLANEVRKSERALREGATLKPEQIPGSFRRFARQKFEDSSTVAVVIETGNPAGDNAILAPISFFAAEAASSTLRPPLEGAVAVDVDKKSSTLSVKNPRSFASFRSAASKKQDVQITIPGCIGGDAPPSFVPSHPSHSQSIQAAVAATKSSSGRSDMWPLQILDMADKQRAARKASQSSVVTSSSSANGSRAQPNVAMSGVSRSNGSGTPLANQTLQQGRSSHRQRIAPTAVSPARSPRRTASAMAGGIASPAVNQQFVAPQPPIGQAPPSGK